MKSKSLRLLALLCCLPLLAACGSTESSIQSSSSSVDSSSSTSVDDSTSSSSSDDDLPSEDDEGGDDDDEGNTGEGDDDEGNTGEGEGDGGDDSGDTTTAPYSSAQEVWDDLAELADTYPYLTSGTINSATITNSSVSSTSTSTIVNFSTSAEEVLIDEVTDGTELQNYYGIQDGVYYSLTRLGAAYPTGSRQEVTENNEASIKEDIADVASDYSFSSFLYGQTYGLGVSNLSLYNGFSEVFTDEIINGAEETETLSEDEVEGDDETGDTDTGDDDGDTEDGDGEGDGEGGEVVEPWVPQEAITNFQIVYSDFYGSWIFQIDSYSEGTSYCSELSLTGYVSTDGTFTSLSMTRDRYMYGSTWDEVNHAPVEGASPSTSWTLSLSGLEFATELPEAGSSHLLSNPSQYYMTSYTAYLPGSWNWDTGVRTDDNTVNVGDTVGTFYVYSEWSDTASNYVYQCTPSNAVDRDDNIYMVAKEDGDYTYFTEDESGNWVVTLPEGTDESTFEGAVETVTVSNGFVTSQVNLAISGTAGSSGSISDGSADISEIKDVITESGSPISFEVEDYSQYGEGLYLITEPVSASGYNIIVVQASSSGPFDLDNVSISSDYGVYMSFAFDSTDSDFGSLLSGYGDDCWGIAVYSSSYASFSFTDSVTTVQVYFGM